MRSWLFWLVLVSATWTSSCIEVMRWERQDVFLRYDARADVAELLLVYDDVYSGSENTAAAERTVEAIAARKRYFAIGDWPLEFDLDECVIDADSNPIRSWATDSPPPGSPEALAIEFFRGVEVTEASLHLEGPGYLSVVQRIRLPRFSLVVQAANLALSRGILADTGTGSAFTESEWQAWRDHARSGDPWITIGADGLEFRAPHGAHWLAALMRHVAKEADDAAVAGMAQALTELALADGLAVFRWNSDETHTITLHFGAPHGARKSADSALARRIANSQLPLEHKETAEARVQRWRSALTQEAGR
ncbi:MAG: hypothetical protein L6Q99_14190 [Planctomycetes bacterium]|nr:hypothetical protein [Planctomycetota bacterium]